MTPNIPTTGIYLHHASGLCALGNNLNAIAAQLFTASSSPLQNSQAYSALPLPIGQVMGELPACDTRNNGLLQAALVPIQAPIETLKNTYGTNRIGVVIGTSTSGISEGEAAVKAHIQCGQLPAQFHYSQQEIAAPSQFVASFLGLTGPAYTISTACTSGAKAIASGARLLNMGACDAVVVGGADSLCKLTLAGFSALAAVSPEVCKPFSQHRKGINIGEGAVLFILSRNPSPVRLVGVGETSDAHHISAPEPQGLGAEAAMQAALTMAKLAPSAIGYLNLHGTATLQNDHMEALACARVFGQHIACSSTKALTGHTLGAAGALEALFCYLTLLRDDGRLPSALWDNTPDPLLPHLSRMGATQNPTPTRYAMSNSFAFGGNNISLILERCNRD